MIFKQFVLSKCGYACGAPVNKMFRFEGFAVISDKVVQEPPMEHFATLWTMSGILAFVCQILHSGRN